jgi:hypothetical protein
MRTLAEFVKKGWRAFMTAAFVLLVFTVPASKGILGKIFGANAAGKQQAGNKNNNQNQAGNDKHNDTGAVSSRGAPSSKPSASPIKQGDTCSTGRQHNASHGNHHRNHHSHYYKPNAK